MYRAWNLAIGFSLVNCFAFNTRSQWHPISMNPTISPIVRHLTKDNNIYFDLFDLADESKTTKKVEDN